MSFESLLLILGVVIVILLVILLLRKPKDDNVQDQLEKFARALDDRLHRSTSELNLALRHQGSDTQRLIQDITKELTEVKESNKQVFSITE